MIGGDYATAPLLIFFKGYMRLDTINDMNIRSQSIQSIQTYLFQAKKRRVVRSFICDHYQSYRQRRGARLAMNRLNEVNDLIRKLEDCIELLHSTAPDGDLVVGNDQ